VQVSWTGVQRPTTADAVCLYFAGADPNSQSPLKYKWALQSKNYLQTGAGSHRSAPARQWFCLCENLCCTVLMEQSEMRNSNDRAMITDQKESYKSCEDLWLHGMLRT
jgi:hypothetical protein